MGRRIKNIPSNFAKIYSNGEFKTPYHIKLIENNLIDIANGNLSRLIVNMPPRHGKSELISRYFVAWYLANFPQSRIFLIGYGSSLAIQEYGEPAKRIYKYFLRNRSSDLILDTQSYWKNAHGGEVLVTGINGEITGKGANLIIIDDPVKGDRDASSKTQRDSCWDFWRGTLYPRMQPECSVIIVQTRWHYDDLTGRLLADNYDNWKVLKLPAINDKGEALWPEMYNREKLEMIKLNQGSYRFSAQYQQEPIASEYQIFNPSNWRKYDFYNPPKCQYIVNVMDTAFETGKENDYSVCATWGISGTDIYLLNLWRRKVQFPDLIRETVRLFDLYKPNYLLVEKAGSGRDLVPMLKTQTKIRAIKEISVMDKVVRAHSIQGYIEQGKVFIPENAPWTPDFINEHAEFPNGKHDDIVDTTGFALQHLAPMVSKRPILLTGNSSGRTQKKDSLIYY